MDLVFTAIVPIVLMLGLGYLLRHRWVPDPGFWRGLEWLTYHVFTPALFVVSIARADLGAVSAGPLLACLALPMLAVALLVLAFRRPMRADGPEVTSLVQGSIRFNTYIGLVFASALHGAEGIAAFALAAAVAVPLVNVISVSALAVHGHRQPGAPRPALWRSIAGNPLILGCAAGLLLNLGRVPLPAFAATTLDMVASPALVAGTMAAGAALTFRLRRRDLVDIASTSVLKLLLLPLAAGALAVALGVGGSALAGIVVICALPVAPSAYVLAARMGGDTRLMAVLTGSQTLLSLGSVPLVLYLTGAV